MLQTKTLSSYRNPPEQKVLLPIKISPDLRRRFRTMASSKDMTYEQLIKYLLDKYDGTLARQRAQKLQPSPLHPPRRKSHYPGGGL